ncbi:hypothetical protein RND71_042767 [Anisodus tanguticus]|uniref:Uncharacterized protein n=1 Tax=Anisodus tanguticus TaxID=243964 RepID=A0AAE1QRJ4_9SOLA|nr:hypothetical protein RND71_042767 [Anisodus tanguticus]
MKEEMKMVVVEYAAAKMEELVGVFVDANKIRRMFVGIIVAEEVQCTDIITSLAQSKAHCANNPSFEDHNDA